MKCRFTVYCKSLGERVVLKQFTFSPTKAYIVLSTQKELSHRDSSFEYPKHRF